MIFLAVLILVAFVFVVGMIFGNIFFFLRIITMAIMIKVEKMTVVRMIVGVFLALWY